MIKDCIECLKDDPKGALIVFSALFLSHVLAAALSELVVRI